jgi:hypothetical protein
MLGHVIGGGRTPPTIGGLSFLGIGWAGSVGGLGSPLLVAEIVEGVELNISITKPQHQLTIKNGRESESS